MNIKPGDLFHWVSKKYDVPVKNPLTSIYSRITKQGVSCYGICFCIGYANNTLYWISNNRITRLSLNDVYAHGVWLKPKKIK